MACLIKCNLPQLLVGDSWGREIAPYRARPQSLFSTIVPGSHRRVSVGIVSYRMLCDGSTVVGDGHKTLTLTAGVGGRPARLIGRSGVRMSGRVETSFMRSQELALGFPSKGRWFTPRLLLRLVS